MSYREIYEYDEHGRLRRREIYGTVQNNLSYSPHCRNLGIPVMKEPARPTVVYVSQCPHGYAFVRLPNYCHSVALECDTCCPQHLQNGRF